MSPDVEKYLRYCDEERSLSVKLSAEEQAAILRAYDHGAENTDRQLLQSVIAKLKDEIWA